MRNIGPLRALLIGALLGGIGPLLLVCAAFAGFWILYLGPGFAGEEQRAVAGLILLAVLTLGALAGAATCGYAAAVGGRLGLFVAVLLGLIAGLGPAALLAAADV